MGELEIEPEWWGGGSRPDAYTEQLVPEKPCAIEIAATSDNAISGEEAMDNVAIAIGQHADRFSKGISAFFYYPVQRRTRLRKWRYFRRRLAPLDYELSENAAKLIEDWIASGAASGTRLHVVEPGLDVEIERSAHKQIRYHNVWSSMPPETHSIDDNPLYKLLKRKAAQLKGSHRDTLRFIFLTDVGSALLNRLGRFGEIDHTRRRVSGSEILSQFMQAHKDRIDAIGRVRTAAPAAVLDTQSGNKVVCNILRASRIQHPAGGPRSDRWSTSASTVRRLPGTVPVSTGRFPRQNAAVGI